MGKGSNTTTTNSSSSATSRPDENAYQAYLALMNRASGVAATPYEGYTGEQVAPVNAQQTQGISGINQAADFISGQETPLSAADIQRYQDPYTQSVIDATQRDFDVQNQRNLSNVTGNAASVGALGGDRAEVAKALANESANRTQAPIIAGLRSAGYQNAVNTAAGQQQQMLRAGIAAQQAAGQQVGAGTLQQQTQQAQDTQARLDYYQQQGYPFQVAQWLAAIDTGVGSQLGGTTNSVGTSTRTGPTPNLFSQLAGVGLAGIGLWPGKERGGRVAGFAGGGMPGVPWSEGPSWVPTVGGITGGKGAPAAAAFPSVGGDDKQPGLSKDQMKGIGAIGKGAMDWLNTGERGMSVSDLGSSTNPLPGLSADDYQGWGSGGNQMYGLARGGRVRNYAGFGAVLADDDEPATFDERFAAARPSGRISAGVGSSRPAFGNDNEVYDDNQGPFRLDPAEYEKTMQRIDRDTGQTRSDAATSQGAPKPQLAYDANDAMEPQGGPPAVVAAAKYPSLITEGRSRVPAEAADEGSGAMALAGDNAPSRGIAAPPPAYTAPPDESFLGRLGIKVTPELKQGLLQAGLALMASRHGGPGSFLSNLGEAGMTGVGAYNQTIQNQHDEAEKLRKEAFEREKFERSYQEMTAAQKAVRDKEYKPTWDVIRTENDPDTGLKREIYGWIDPNTKQVTEGSGQAAAAPAGKAKSVYVDESGAVVTGDTFLERLKQVSPERAIRAKQVADYKVNPAGLSVRGGRREQAIADASAYNPDYDQRFYGASAQAIKNFNAGVESRTVRSLNVAIDHLATLDEAALAMKNSDYKLLNRVVNAYREQTGNPVTTNFDSIKQTVSAEIAKAVVGGQTALHDRDDMARRAANSQGPDVLLGITKEFRKLMAGQMKGLRHTYETSTRAKNFDDYLEPETKKVLKGLEHVEDNYNKGGEGGAGGFKPPSGAVARTDSKGKVWYFDPNTKQPYPGQ